MTERPVVQKGRRGRFISFKPLENRSLEAYKAYILAIGEALVGDKLIKNMSEAEWEESWRLYWAYRDALIKGRDEGILQ